MPSGYLSQTFIAKNEQVDELVGPLKIPLHVVKGRPHPLRPVCAFKNYMEHTEGASENHLFYNSKTQKLLPPRSLARLLCRIIEIADSGHSP